MLARYLRSILSFERDARLFLVITLVSASAVSLWWIDFNLYLVSLGYSSTIAGLIGTVGSATGLVAAFPASMVADRLGRRFAMLLGGALMTAAYVGLLLTSALPMLFVLGACFAMGSGTMQIVSQPFLAEHSRPHERNDLFAIQFAIGNATSVLAAVGGAFIAQQVAASAGFDPQGPQAYRVLIAIMAGLGIISLFMLARLRDDRPGPASHERGAVPAPSEPQARSTKGPTIARSFPAPTIARSVPAPTIARSVPAPTSSPAARRRLDLASAIRRRVSDPADFAKLLLPGFLISLGAGQIIPWLNMYVEARFQLDLGSLNLLFAVTSLGTLVATLIQPTLARRFGKVGSVVLVQAASIPFIVVLGWSPIFWTVAVAMMVRNSLMNAGNPIFNAFAMEHVATSERATFAAANNLLWNLGWMVGATWYSLLQATLGFFGGYNVNFLTIIVLYTVGTALYWAWFGHAERDERRELASAIAPRSPAGGPGFREP